MLRAINKQTSNILVPEVMDEMPTCAVLLLQLKDEALALLQQVSQFSLHQTASPTTGRSIQAYECFLVGKIHCFCWEEVLKMRNLACNYDLHSSWKSPWSALPHRKLQARSAHCTGTNTEDMQDCMTWGHTGGCWGSRCSGGWAWAPPSYI